MDHLRDVVVEPLGQQVGEWTLAGEERHEVEPASKGGVDEADRLVRGVHRAEYQQVAREDEWLAG